MANELKIQATAGFTLWARIVSEAGTIWDGSALVETSAVTDAEWTSSLIAMTEEETSDETGTGLYVADWPDLSEDALYTALFFKGASPSPGDLVFGQQNDPTGILNELVTVPSTTTTFARIISKTWKVAGVLTNVTSAKLSDPTGTYGVKRNDTDAVIVADGTDMTNTATGIYQYSFTDVVNVAYTAWVEFVYAGATYHFEIDFPARSATGTMVVSYSSLLERIGHQLFGIRSGYSSDNTSDIEECIKDGLFDVYTAHKWSFFRPIEYITTTAPYDTGTIEVADGVVTLSDGTFPSWAAQGILKVDGGYYDVDTRTDGTTITLEDTSVDVDAGTSYELGRPEYDLPTAFEAIVGKELAYESGQSDLYPPVRERHDDALRRWRQDNPVHNRPIYFSTRTAEFDPIVGSRRRLALYPTPDAAYVLKVPMQLRTTMIDAVSQYPVGGESLSQVITEACLAAAERNYDEEVGRHTERFQAMLPLAIAADLEMTSPTQLGPDAPRDERKRFISRASRLGDISFNGTIL